MSKYCSACGTSLREGAKFCIICGVNLEEQKKEETITEDDIKITLSVLNNLLDKLPEKVIDDFTKTKEFYIYERVMRKYKIK